ncbi:MAG: endonuclease III domain-containing protein [Candidatus Aenigmarchaeota archaeon]|nr:endonuclease III domain-containing protein [Candidatus Aenigmarchaeota archaeon]
MPMDLRARYLALLEKHGRQGWWPVTREGGPTYHPGDYSFPRTEEQQWEICMGAVLTQNTAWKNAEQALASLRQAGILLPEDVLRARAGRLARLVRPSGYFNQKARTLRELAAPVAGEGGVRRFLDGVSRDELLRVKGIGPETADSLLLYAAKRPSFVVDAYTRRLFGGRLFPADAPYEAVRRLFEERLPRDWRVYNEFHALIVREGKGLGIDRK